MRSIRLSSISPLRSLKLKESRRTPEELVSELDKTKPIIVIDYQSMELLELAAAGADVDLNGHTHDGQAFPGNLLLKLLWENSCGYLKVGEMHSVVTSGAEVWVQDIRVGTDSELVVLRISN